MIRDEQIPELASYREYENHLSLETSESFATSVIFRGNDSAPVHNWFRFKEGFDSGLLRQVLDRFKFSKSATLELLDPFCGVGTTLLSAQLLEDYRVRAVGIERNPFIGFVADTKLAWRELRHESLLKEGLRAIQTSSVCGDLPELSSIRDGRCISKHMAGRLLGICGALRSDNVNYRFLKLGIAAAIEPLSKIRRDGRALRIVEKPYQTAEGVITPIWSKMAADARLLCPIAPKLKNSAVVRAGDGRVPSQSEIDDGSIDLILTSPPYPNNIDYSEVYKLELWLMGFVSSYQDFLSLRHSTFRSHPTFDKSAELAQGFIDELERGALQVPLGVLLNRINAEEYGWRAKLLKSYFADCWTSLANYHKALRRGGRVVLVVGNSLHGTDVPALVATDLVLCKMGECLGYEVENLIVARGLRRRLSGNHFLRESVVVLRKADAV